ncbi:hypothetical protein Tco_1400481 [Tanacetum coccineum]
MAAKCLLEEKIENKDPKKDTLIDLIFPERKQIDHMETKNAQDVGKTREIVDEEKEIDENILSTEDVLSTDKEKVSTDRPIGKKKIEEEDESESESDGIPKAEKKFKQLASDEEIARKCNKSGKARIEADRLLAEKLQEQEREQFTIEERAKYQDEIPEDLINWKLHGSSGVHTLVTEAGLVIHILVEKKYPLRKKVLVQMLKLKLESEEDSTMALELIRFVKKLLAELEPEDSDGDEEDL